MEIWSSLYEQLLETSWLEFIAVICGILSVWFSKQESILVYPFGIVSVVIFVYLTNKYGLYAETGINVYYFLMSIYGWWNWKNTKDIAASQIPITRSSTGGHFVNVGTFLLATIFIYIMLIKFTDSTVPLIDSITTGLAITGMYLMALKKIEHWLFWIACDLISIPLYIYKGLPFTSLQFLVFTALAIMGWMSWKRKLIMSES
ncbi:nicotinamide riboside transporter PnuC [Ekhidna sp.]|uniref:nicotinamide riboside transporter PnuC n=1 Tax=Ekhidna sp. TaxID=2608089 RepID=UPI00329A4906